MGVFDSLVSGRTNDERWWFSGLTVTEGGEHDFESETIDIATIRARTLWFATDSFCEFDLLEMSRNDAGG